VASQAYAMQAPATRTAMASWSACMSWAGLHYASPLQAADAHAEQSRTASADLACRDQANLQQVLTQAESQYQAKQLASHLTAIQQSVIFVNDWLSNARNAGVSLAPSQSENVAASGVTGLSYFTGPVTYTNLSYGQRLDLWHSQTKDGNKVDLYPVNGGNAQNWLFSNTLSNGCRVLAPNLNENYAVQDPSGSLAYNEPANIWYYGSSNPPTWYTVEISQAAGYPDQYYVIRNCEDWLFLNPYHGGNGGQLTWSVGGSGYQAGNEVWN
jgi:hypothetical protein